MKTSNVICHIIAPQFCKLHPYNDGFKVTASIRVTPAVYGSLLKNNGVSRSGFKPIEYMSKYYIHWEKFYSYHHTSFDTAFDEARLAVDKMMIMSRLQKVSILEEEICCIAHRNA